MILEDGMADIVYNIVKHAEGWAYQVGGTYSETFRSHDSAREAARDAARHHSQSGQTVGIIFENSNGEWREELSDGTDRPHTRISG